MTHVEELKSSGLKATLPRIKILEVFQHAERRHMTAEDVFKALLHEGSDIGLATVYRVLMQFEQAGLLTRSNFESGKAVFELNEGQHHDHLVCLDCGRVEEFFDPEIEARQRAASTCRNTRWRCTPAAPSRPARTAASDACRPWPAQGSVLPRSIARWWRATNSW